MQDNYLSQQYKNSHLIIKQQASRGSLLLGDFNSATDQLTLANHNIKTIITAADNMDHLQIDPNIKHITYPLLDGKNQKISLFFNQSYNHIDQNLKKGGVLVHCAAGISRSATLIIAYLMKKNKWTFKQAFKYVKNIRSIICPNLGFQLQLKQYQKQLAFGKADTFSKTLVPIRQNLFVLLSQQSKIPRASFPNITPMGHIQSRTKYKRRKPIETRWRMSYHQDRDELLLKSNLMINTVSGYEYIKFNVRQGSFGGEKILSNLCRKQQSVKLARIVLNNKVKKWSSQNGIFEDSMIKQSRNEIKNTNSVLKRK